MNVRLSCLYKDHGNYSSLNREARIDLATIAVSTKPTPLDPETEGLGTLEPEKMVGTTTLLVLCIIAGKVYNIRKMFLHPLSILEKWSWQAECYFIQFLVVILMFEQMN